MKKLIIVLCITLLLISGCNENSNFIGNVSDIKISNNNKDVLLTIKDGTLKDTTTSLILENNTNKTLYYDEVYEIEIKKDNKWHKINVELDFDLPLWMVKPKSREELKLDWKYGYGKLEPGKYRIVKKVYFEEENSFYISAEFIIK